MTEIARLLELKYKDCCPLFSALGDCQEKIQSAFDDGKTKIEKIEKGLHAVENSISQASVYFPGGSRHTGIYWCLILGGKSGKEARSDEPDNSQSRCA